MHLRAVLLALVVSAATASAGRAATIVAAGAPSALGLPFSRFSDPALDDAGRVAFLGGSAVLFQVQAGTLRHVLAAGERGPGGRVVADIGPPAAGRGAVAMRLLFAGGDAGVYRLRDAQLELLASAGALAPGGGRFAGFGATVAVSGDGGRVAFSALLDNGVHALFVTDGTTSAVVARTGEPSPGGGAFQQFRLLGVTNDGRVGFRAAVASGPDGLFFWDGAAIATLAVAGDASPIGGQFVALGAGSMNDAGGWVFRATVSGPRSGVFRADPSTTRASLRAVVVEGDPTPIGGTFRPFAASLVPAINAGGTIAFRGVVADGRFSSGIFLAPPEGGVEKVVGVGETTGAGRLAQLRDPVLADDDGVIVPASLIGGPPGLFRVTRARTVAELALLDEATDLGGGFRFIEPSVRDNAEGAIFLGLREGIFVASGPGQVSLVAMLGEPTPLGGRYQQFDPPAAGAGGRIVFAAAVLGPGFRRALFLAGPAGAVPLLKTGDGAPGGGSIRDFFVGVLDAAARVSVGPGGFAFQAELARTSSATGLFLRLGRRRLAVARADEHAPGGGRYSSFGTPAHLGGRRAAFVARLTGTASNLGVFLKSGRRTRALARAGEATATRLAGNFQSFDSPAAGPAGVAFRAVVDQRARQGLFVVSGRARDVLVASGDAAPDGGRFTNFDAPVFAANRVVFHAAVSGGAHTEGIFRVAGAPQAPPSPVEALAWLGGPAPGGGSFLAFGGPAGNAAGTVALTADLQGGPAARAVLVFP
ncbi:MAG: hypothetical protein E6J55_15955 [Deltaproteobacteria bacterium]|nr:MAG: hypothetical protein E6J55_15955 [Deltaproteobacteria bacterium]